MLDEVNSADPVMSGHRFQLQHRLSKADAGTGKTYTLTVHFLRLLAAGVDPRRVLATTFTRKAAGEILERILLRVAEAALDEGKSEALARDLELEPHRFGTAQSRAWLTQLADVMPGLNVSTLDAFFRRLVGGFRYELGLVRMQRVASLDDPSVVALRERAVQATLESLGSGLEPLSQLTMRLYRGHAQRSIAWAVDRVLLELYQVYREAPDVEVWSRIEVPEGRLSEGELAAATGRWLDEWQADGDSERKAVQLRLGKRVVSALERSAELLNQRDWKGLLSIGLSAIVDKALVKGESGCSYYSKPLQVDLFEAYVPLVRHARAQLLYELREQTIATHRLLEEFHGHFSRIRRREGVVLFSDLADIVARELPLLSSDLQLAVAYRLDGQVEHVLLDEFQDTSTVQWSGLGLLVKEVLAWGSGEKTLFCVGDSKQSIYGWRGGRPELFDVVERELEGMGADAATIAPLKESYRSSPVVLDAVNQVFSSIGRNRCLKAGTEDQTARATAAAAWCQDFAEHRAAPLRASEPGYVVLRTSLGWEGMFDEEVDEESDTDGGAVDEQPLGHLGFAAAQVGDVVRRRPTASVGVLTRSNRVVSEMLFALRQHGIEASGEGHGSIVDDEAVTSVISAFRLASSPIDSASLIHLAQTALGEVLAVDPVFGHAPVSEQRLMQATRELSEEVRAQLFEHGACALLSRWCRSLSERLPLRSLARLQQTLEVLIDQQALLDRRPRELVQFLQATTVEEPAPAQVRVMTVHQAKGLEFDVVVLCELETQLGALYSPLVETLRDDPIAAPSAVFRASNEATRRSDPALQVAHSQEVQRRMRDDLSAVYVALTRARSELHMLVQPVSAPPGKRKPVEKFAAAGMLRAALCSKERYALKGEADRVLFSSGAAIVEDSGMAGEQPGQVQDVDASSPATSVSDSRSEDRRSTRSDEIRTEVGHDRPRPDASQRFAESRVQSADAALEALDAALTVEPRGVARGRLLHAYLARVEWLPTGSRGRKKADEANDPVNTELWQQACLQVAPGHDPEWTAGVRADLGRMLKIASIRQVLEKPPGLAQCWRERRFAFWDQAGEQAAVVRGVFDRVVVTTDESGQVLSAHVIDWKTGAGHERQDAYRSQLMLYRRAVAAFTGLIETGVRCTIVWLDRRETEDV